MPQPLTPRQKSVLDFVNEAVGVRGEMPTLDEIAKSQNLSSASNMHRILHELENKGYLQLRKSMFEIHKTKEPEASARSKLTGEELRIYDAVVSAIGRDGYAPTLREIKDELGDVSLRKVQYLLEALERKSFVALASSQANGISLVVPDGNSTYPVVIQGVPCDASDFLSGKNQSARVWDLPLARLNPYFVEADIVSIFGVALLDDRALTDYSVGDALIASRARNPKRGDIVVAEYKDRVVARHYSSDRTSVTLSSQGPGKAGRHNPLPNVAEDIHAEIYEVEILGVVFAAVTRL